MADETKNTIDDGILIEAEIFSIWTPFFNLKNDEIFTLTQSIIFKLQQSHYHLLQALHYSELSKKQLFKSIPVQDIRYPSN